MMPKSVFYGRLPQACVRPLAQGQTFWGKKEKRRYKAQKHVTFPAARFFCEQTRHTSQKRKLTIFGNTKQVIQDYDTLAAFDNSIPFRKNDPLRITYFRIPGVSGLNFVPWHRLGDRDTCCLGAKAQSAGPARPVF
jgi:hypothetical protein